MFTLTPEKKQLYKKNLDEKKSERKKNLQKRKKGIEASPANLQFLEDIFKAKNIKWSDLENAGILTQQNVHYIRLQDDISLRKLRQMMAELGLNISPEFEGMKADESAINAISVEKNYSIVDEDNGEIIAEEKAESVLTSYAKKAISENHLLAFLATVILSWENSELKLSEKTGIFIKSYQNYFIKDDIKISRINQIGRALDMRIIWRVSKVKK